MAAKTIAAAPAAVLLVVLLAAACARAQENDPRPTLLQMQDPRVAARTLDVGMRSIAKCHRDWFAKNNLYAYAWCGAAPDALENVDKRDIVATIDSSPSSSTFGTVINVARTNNAFTQAHHAGVDASRKWLAAGGLVSVVAPTPTPDIFVFDVSNPAKPSFSHALTAKTGACVDEFLPLASGGFAISAMCGRDGKPGGGGIFTLGVGRNGERMRNLEEWDPKLPAADKPTFNSHGVDFDVKGKRGVTCDFIDISSTLVTTENPTPTPLLQKSVRIWDLDKKKVIKTIDLSGYANGLMDVRYSGRDGLFWATNGYGQWILVDSKKKTFSTEFAYCLDPNCERVPGTCINSPIFADKTRMLITSYTLNETRLVDISNPRKLKTLDTYKLGIGGHVVKIHEPSSIAVVSTYFVDQPGSVIRLVSNKQVSLLYIDLEKDKIMPLKIIDFSTAVDSSPQNCHGLSFNWGRK